ncbi:MAG: YggS family pyridoxal phosphate-dependent enzyme [Candidatus Cloacimonetes bacterium]|nr:YggS family pyridoxal phosphate-dependent enzyme [Candidatus Cloacimonadota bacterium]MCF7813059.1 YggS family pyridoxal phosphate-dependent enzyme [Candidatus Cloacimonadota bacterium]MCF7867200.1 YggS family pyridoxal phosphate-dependent enzyme [Candidatus Cloacimonadota bacterium]MCF7882644.1 YggS family pyridoxal phosphate-dependent enzyme [Candidatus Cloacimonadota bacterium]
MSIAQNIAKVKSRIEAAAKKCGRNSSEIKLLAVTKTHPVSTIEEALANGIRSIGENRIQEAEEKIPQLSGKFSEFHFIGHLQSNKIKKLMPLNPVLIHSIDKFSTARKLNDYLTLYNREQDLLVQVNTSSEESKFGIEPKDTIKFVKQISELTNLHLKGLMTIGKFTDNQHEIRACFKMLRELSEIVKDTKIPNVEMKYLSMGMTSDFELAIEEGANIVRIGSAIFGSRNY